MTTILGVFDDPIQARRAMETLQSGSLPLDDVSIISRATESGAAVDSDEHITAGEGAAVGAVWGGLVGLAALLIPGIGPFVAGGALFAALTGAATGAVIGGIAGALIDSAGIPEEEARRYETMIHEGKTLVAVKARAEYAPEVRRILASAGADSLHEEAAEGARMPVHVAMYENGRRVDIEEERAIGDTAATASAYGARGIYDTPTTSTRSTPAPGTHDYSAADAAHDPYARSMPNPDARRSDTSTSEHGTWTKGEWVGEGQGEGPHTDTGSYNARQWANEGQGERSTWTKGEWVGEGQGEGPHTDTGTYDARQWVGEGQGDEVTPDRPNTPPAPRRDTNLPDPDDTPDRHM